MALSVVEKPTGRRQLLPYNCGISNSKRCMLLENGKQCGISYLVAFCETTRDASGDIPTPTDIDHFT